MTPGRTEQSPRAPLRPSRRGLFRMVGEVVAGAAAAGLGLAATKAAPPPPITAPPSRLAPETARAAQPAAPLEKIRAVSTADTYGPKIGREFLERNPISIKATAYVTDTNGNVTKEYAVLDNGILYQSTLEPTSRTFAMFAEVSKAPLENPTSLVASADGKTLLMGGETPIRSGATKMYISYDKGKQWKNIDWPYQDSGSTIDLLKFTENNYLGNNGNWEGGIGQFVVEINPSGGTAQVRAASYESLRATNFNAGGARDISIASINTATRKAEMISDGSDNLRQGIVLYKNFDFVEGTGTVENITHVITEDDPNKELGFLYGGAQYTDAQGHPHFKTSDPILQLTYDIDLVTRTATKEYYGNKFDNKGITNYSNGSLRLGGLDINGNYTWAAGTYQSTKDSASRAVLINLETGEYYDLAPNTESSIDQKRMKRVKINGQTGYELTIVGLGKAFVPTNPDGSPIPGAQPVYTSRGLGNQAAFLTNRVLLPNVKKD